MSRAFLLLVLAVAIASFASTPARAQQATASPSTPNSSAKYHLAIAKTHNVHANDHVRLLQKYAQAHKSVPPEVVKDHADSVRFHLNAAKASYAKLAGVAKDQQGVLDQIDEINKRLAKVSGLVKKLETESNESAEIAVQTAAITKELAANHAAAQQVDNNFYNMESSNYYEDGLGHFTD